MTTYYVGSGGNNSSAGTTWATRWLTIGKALGSAGISSGDTVYIAPGTYREQVSVGMTSATATTYIIADLDGSNTSGSPGPVYWTNYNTNEKTLPTNSPLLTLSGRDFLSFSGITFIGGGDPGGYLCVRADTTTSTDITFTKCSFIGVNQRNLIRAATAFGTSFNWLIDQCIMFSRGATATQDLVFLDIPTGSGSDYDLNFIMRNCLLVGVLNVPAIGLNGTGAGAQKGGGVIIENSTIMTGNISAIRTINANTSTAIPCIVRNSVLIGGGISASTSGQFTETYNLFYCPTARTNVASGTGSISDNSYAPHFHVGQEMFIPGAALRGFLEPLSGSPLLGFGNSSAPSVDFLNRPRPAGGSSTSNAVGYLERHNTAVKETSVTDAGGVGIKIVGPGDHDFLIPVNATSTTITIKARYNSAHSATNKPQIILQNNNEIGVSAQTVTMTSNVDTWERLTIGPFTPTGPGVVTVRLVSRAAAGDGIAYFDTFTVT